MKILILFIFSFSCFASNWMSISKIQSQSNEAYQLQSECEKQGEQCLDVGNEPDIVSKGFVSLIDKYAKEDEQNCEDEQDCTAKFLELVCTNRNNEKIQNNDLKQVYCVRYLGKELVKDLSSFNSYKIQKAAKDQLEAGIGIAQSLRLCGQRVMDLMLVRNQPKNLNTTQIKQLVSGYSSIKALLESGSLVSAKEEIQAVNADGVLVTNGDKTALVEEIDKCLGL